jgi:hypothetical protein
MNPKIYPIGSFSGWRDEFINKFSNFNWDDPRNHIQSSIAKLDYSDMSGAMNCSISFIYMAENKRAGTMSYAELGASRAKGNCIIAFDEDNTKDDLISKISSHYITSRDELENLLNGHNYSKKFSEIQPMDKTANHKPYESVLFTGDVYSMGPLINKTLKDKKVFVNKSLDDLDNFSDEIDLIVVNFDKGKKHDKKGLFFMGMGYALDIPVIELEGNVIPYPPLLGLARRALVGKDRFKQAEHYLKNLKSQHITDEALVYYDLMKKFNQNGI